MFRDVAETPLRYLSERTNRIKACGLSIRACDVAIFVSLIFFGYLIYAERTIPVAPPWVDVLPCPLAIVVLLIMRCRLEIIYSMIAKGRVSQVAYEKLAKTGSGMTLGVVFLMVFFSGFLGNRLDFILSVIVLIATMVCSYFAMFCIPEETLFQQSSAYSEKSWSVRFIPAGIREKLADTIWEYL